MAPALLIVVSLTGASVGLGAVLAAGLGPVAALILFWLGGMVATLALANDFAHTTARTEVADELPQTSEGSE